VSKRRQRDNSHRESTSKYLLTAEVFLVHQLAEALQLRGLSPDHERDQAIEHLRRLRNDLAHNPRSIHLDEDDVRPVLLAVLAHLRNVQRSSLGSSYARELRRQTSPADISEILNRTDTDATPR
jgi:hypothetical protein